MKLIASVIAATLLSWTVISCSSNGNAPQSFCDTACITDTANYTLDTHPLKPFIKIGPAECFADSLVWGHNQMETRKLAMQSLFGSKMKLNKNAMDAAIRDTSYAWLMFNNCVTGRGYLAKIPYNTKNSISIQTSAVNRFDPKYSVNKSLIAYCDRGNIFVEDIQTGKKAMMTFGKRIEIDYDKIHDFIDTVNITPTSIYTKVKLDGEWKDLSKTIELK